MPHPPALEPAVHRTRMAVAGATLLSFLLPLAVYLPTQGDYWIRYDNEFLIRQQPIIQTLALSGFERLSGLLEMFTTAHGDLYQPLLSFSLAIDYALFDWDRSGWHAHSLLLHMAVTAGAFLLSHRLVGAWKAALAATLFVSLHPVAVESVSCIINRVFLVTAAWLLVGSHAYLSYVRDPRRWGWLALATLAFGVSGMAKAIPSVVLLPFFFDLWLGRRASLRLLLEKLPLLAIVLFLTGLNLVFSQQTAGQELSFSLLTKLSHGVAGLALSIANSLVPENLAVLYPARATWEILGWRVGVAGLGVLGVLGAGVALWRRGQRGLLLCAAAWLAMLAPFLIAALLYRAAATADRYLYLPLLFAGPGIAQAMAWLPTAAPAVGRVVLVLFVAWTAVLAGHARSQARDWSDEVALWRTSIANAGHPISYGSLGSALAAREDWRGVVDAYRSALSLLEEEYRGLSSPLYYDGAAKLALTAAERTPRVPTVGEGSRRDYLEFALESATRGAERWPEMGQFEVERGRALMQLGDSSGAIRSFERAVELDRYNARALVELGLAVYYENGDSDRAEALLGRAIREQHADPRILEVLGPIYQARSEFALAAQVSFTWVLSTNGSQQARERFLAIARRGLASNERQAVRTWIERYLEQVPEPGAVRDLLALPRP